MERIQFKKEYIIKSIAISVLFFAWNISSGLLIYKYLGVSLGKQTGYSYSKAVEFFLVVLLGPIIETILFQFLVINQVFISYNGRYQTIIAVLISAFCFGIIHLYSLYYFLVTLIGGLLLAYCFCGFKKMTNAISAIFYITLIHSLSNFYMFIIKIFEL